MANRKARIRKLALGEQARPRAKQDLKCKKR